MKKHHTMKNRFTLILTLTSALCLFGLTAKAQTGPTIGGSVYGGGNQATVTGPVTVDVTAGDVKKNVFGGGNKAGILHTEGLTDGTATVTISGGMVGDSTTNPNTFGIYGGCNDQGTVSGAIQVNILGGTLGKTGDDAYTLKGIYGGGKGSATETKGNVTVTVGDGTNPTIYGDVYGGSALGKVNDATAAQHTKVDFKNGTLNGTIYGGGMGDGSTAAYVYGDVEVHVSDGSISGNMITGTIKGAVFGGCNINGVVLGDATVEFTGGTIGATAAHANVYGGGLGENTKVRDSVAVKVKTSSTIYGDVYGGSAKGKVNYPETGTEPTSGDHVSTSVTLAGGSVTGDIYGGGHGIDGAFADVGRAITVTVNSGSVNTYGTDGANGGNVFGCNNAAGRPMDSVLVIINNNVTKNVYGGGNLAAYSAPTATPNYPKVNVNNGTMANVFGGGLGASAIVTGNPQVTIGDNSSSHYAVVSSNVYGGGDAAKVIGNTTVTYNDSHASTSVGKMFGGSNAASIEINSSVTGTGKTHVTMVNGKVTGGVYGGCNTSGTVQSDITVDLIGGIVGTENNLLDGVVANVHGGGYGNSTSTNGDIEVNIGTVSAGPTIYGDVYGGSGYGDVNDVSTDKTEVNVLGGTICQRSKTVNNVTTYYGGNVYGGGLGDKASLGTGHHDYVALVNGEVTVNIGTFTPDQVPTNVGDKTGNSYSGNATIEGSVYGCNNTNGSPQDNVTVNVYQTAHTEKDLASYLEDDRTYAIDNVFGGGNEANYTPAIANKKASVNIFSCDNTIRRTFGGGNAANVGTEGTGVIKADVATDILGGRFSEVYGGGNGERGQNYAANIYGNVALGIHGGNVGMFFVGSNQHGTIEGNSTVGVDESGCGSIQVDEFFCGGNYADFVGDIDATISCSQGMHVTNLYGGCNQANVVPGNGGSGNVHLKVYGGTFDNVYGGSKGTPTTPANIAGDVILDIFGGTIDTVFGGSNINGNVAGKIIVNILDQGDCPLILHNVYGGGRNASYTPTKDYAVAGYYPEVNLFHGTVSKKSVISGGVTIYTGGHVFGGGYGESAIVTAKPKVTIGYVSGMTLPQNGVLPSTPLAEVDSLVFGGGDLAAVAGSTTVTIQKSNSSASRLFGGGNNASVGKATVTVTDGTVKTGVYGGCNASGSVGGNIDTHSFAGNVLQTTSVAYPGTIDVYLNGGTVGVNGITTDVVFGGGYGHNTSTTGNIGVTLNGSNVYGNLYGGSALGSVNAGTGNTTTVTLTSPTLHGSVFGGGMGSGSVEATKATSLGNATVNIDVANPDGFLTGIYGGANVNGNVAGNINVNVKANVGTTGGDNNRRDVFGGGLGANTTTGGNVTVTIGYDNTAPTIYGDIYGGSAFGEVGANGKLTKVDFKNGELHGTIYGGGKGQVGNTNTNPAIPAYSAEVSGDVEVAVANGTLSDGIYGGCNANGNVTGDITVNVSGSASNQTTVGTTSTAANIHGGGYGASTSTNGNVTVNFGNTPDTRSEYPKVYGDIYGGSALGWVNDGNDTTMVNILNGEVKKTTSGTIAGGNIYGGGLGDKTNSIAALVKGKAMVNIGTMDASNNPKGKAVIEGSVFGCNNQLGTPQDSVFVNIYSTHHGSTPSTNAYPTGSYSISSLTALATNSATQTYAIESVYGGGNLAAYTPELANNKPRSATVHVYGCASNTIKELYGGGNAADVGTGTNNANTFVVIDGGRINRVFGGGKGDNTSNPQVAANIHGTATTTINAGLIDTIFGGGNMKGTIDSISLVLAHGSSCTNQIYNQVFGGANEAELDNNLVTTINCGVGTIGDVYGGSNKAKITGDVKLSINGGNIRYAYGGSRGDNSHTPNIDAEIDGNTQLNIFGGTIRHAFGGSNLLGSVKGQITVNVLDTVSTCPLSLDTVYGGGNMAPYDPTNTANTPSVNIIHGTVNKYVYGGGLGSSAVVTANPKVTIGYDASTMSSLVTSITASGYSLPASPQAMVIEDVYGGGDAAAVSGSTSVTLQHAKSSVGRLFGGGNQAGVSATATVTVSDGLVNSGLYGGCNTSGNVGGDISVSVTGGTVGTVDTNSADGVFGGGFGNGTSTTGDVAVTIDGSGVNIYGDVYGGSAKGNVNASGKTTTVTLTSGTIHGDLYGGGLGDDTYAALVKGAVQVTVNGGTVNNVFGCNNENGAPQSTVQVNIEQTGSSMNVNNVFGGGNLAQYTGDPQVNVKNGTVSQNVYGGGKGQLVNSTDPNHGVKGKVTGAPQVTIGDNDAGHTAYVTGDVYGGGDAANVAGIPVVVVNDCNTTIGYLYGGGNAADVSGTDITVNAGTINHQAFGGGHGDKTITQEPLKYADVNGNVVFKVSGGSIPQVFAGSNSKGSITGTSNLTINKTSESCSMKLGEVYGGGNEADGNAGTITIGCTGTWTTGHNTHNSTTNRIGYELEGIGTVYGGANQANVNNGIDLTIESGIVENVFGGNNTSGSVNDTIRVTINKDSDCAWYVGNVYGGGNLAQYSAPSNKPNYPKVRVLNGTVSEDVFGGGLGNTGDNGKVTGNPQVIVNGSGAAVNGGVYGGGSLAPTQGNPLVTQTLGATAKVFGGGKAASVTGAPTVAINGGTVSTGVYGGCDSQGNVSGNIIVNVTGGTIGSQANLNQTTPVTADVYGGGFGQSTSTSGNVEVNIGALADTHSEFPKIYGDVYGGSALGNVNDAASDTTTVNILNGTLLSKEIPHTTPVNYIEYIGGNVFGGGLGRKDDPSTGDANEAIEAKVNGVVTVNIGAPSTNGRDLDPDDDVNRGMATIQGNVYGCNNTNGSPQDSVMVHIYRTYRADDEQINYSGNNPKYAIANVFGGGNEANYVPLSTAAHKKLKVMIHGCYNSVRRVFGGSNAAASGNSSISTTVSTNIDGGRFYQVFGGGNGEVSAANIYGDLDLRIHGGIVEQFYGASNQNGTITGNINTLVDNTSGCQSIQITEYFCGGNYSNVYGDLVSTITCSDGLNVTSLYGGCNQANIYGDVVLNLCGGTYTNVFGGSKGVANGISADILAVTQEVITAHPDLNLTLGHGGNVTLNLFGGIIENVYGGSNINGNIQGNITVNVIDAESTTCPLDVTNIYGGSNETDYTPANANATSPVVNVMHVKTGVHGNVYGGSRGVVGATTPTKVVANPKVNIGYEHTTMTIPSGNGIPTLPATANWRSTVEGSVFGGGDAAKVEGNTEINLNKHAKVMQNVYGGGNMGEVNGDTKVIVNGKRQ